MIHNTYIGVVAQAAGTVNAITATYTPAPTVLADKMLLWFRAMGANTTTTPTFSPNGLTAHTIVKQGGQALAAGDIPAVGAVMEVCYDEANTRWELINPAASTAEASYKVYAALLAQSGTNAPIATVLENTLGGSVVWSRNADGDYIATGTGLFTVNKTIIFLSPNADNFPTVPMAFIGSLTVNTINLKILDGGSAGVDGNMVRGIEIRVYP